MNETDRSELHKWSVRRLNCTRNATHIEQAFTPPLPAAGDDDADADADACAPSSKAVVEAADDAADVAEPEAGSAVAVARRSGWI